MPKIHMIVVSFNTREHTMDTLKHLQKYTDIPYRITVIDNGSKDDSLSYLKRWERGERRHTLIKNKKNQGFSQASNQGLALTKKKEFACLVNSDLLVSPGFASRLIHHFQDTKRVGMVGPLGRGIGGFQDYASHYGEHPINKDSFPKFAEELYQKNKGYFKTVKYLMGCCLLISNETLKEVGYLDEAYFGGADDLDYSIRARIKGFDLVVAHDVFVWHHIQASFSLLPQKVLQKIREDSWSHFNWKWKDVFPPNSWEEHFVKEEDIEYPPFRLKKNF